MRRRRARAEDEAGLRARLDQLDRRLEDLEDAVGAAVRSDRLDDLANEVDELAMTTVTHDDLLAVRMHAAYLAAELTRVGAELRAEQARLGSAFSDHLAGRDQAATG